MTCRASSVTFENMNSISVELPSDNRKYVTLNECLEEHFKDMVVDAWRCPNCRNPQVAGRSIRIWSLPPVLVVHLKRFSVGSYEFVKNEIEVGYEVANLNMSRYLHEKSPKAMANYSLYSVHDGRLNSGHYTAYVKNLQTQEWLKFDDECCSRISTSNVNTKKAYILYYTNVKNDSAYKL